MTTLEGRAPASPEAPRDYREGTGTAAELVVLSLVSDAFSIFHELPDALHPQLESGILLSASAVVLLNAFLNGMLPASEAARVAAATASAAEHP